MTESTGTGPSSSTRDAVRDTVHEAYSFACMRCGHGWEQSYEIEHHTAPDGTDYAVYYSDGKRVPSPLTRPTCVNCGGHVVRIMRPGRVSAVQRQLFGDAASAGGLFSEREKEREEQDEQASPRQTEDPDRASREGTWGSVAGELQPPVGATAEGRTEGGTDAAGPGGGTGGDGARGAAARVAGPGSAVGSGEGAEAGWRWHLGGFFRRRRG